MALDFDNIKSALVNKFEDKSNKKTVIDDTTTASDVSSYPTVYAIQTWVRGKLSGKQDTISDLSDIRSGAELGASALQEGDNVSDLINDVGYLTEHQSLANYYTKTQTDSAISSHHDTTKQDKINDLATIRSGAEKGATAVQPSAIANMVETGDNVSVLTNDVGYLTEHQSLANYYTKTQTDSAIGTAISGVTQFDYQVVTTLPSTGVKGTIYLVPNTKGEQDLYDEYLWLTNKWEKIGTTAIDLSNYYTKTQTDSAISNHHDSTKQNTISDLTSIRNGATKGATSVQPNDNVSVLTNNVGYQTASNVESAIQDALDGLADELV